MKLSKERRVYGAILGLAAAAWFADRVFMSGGPDEAAASSVPAPAAPVVQAPVMVRQGGSVALADRLEELRGARPASSGPADAFAVPQEWHPKPEDEAS